LSRLGVIQDPAITIPERNTCGKFGGSANIGQVAFAQKILPAIQELQWSSKSFLGVCRREIRKLGSKVLISLAIIKGTCRKSLRVTLQDMRLLDLTTIRKASVFDAEVVLGVVAVRGDLSPVLADLGGVCEESGQAWGGSEGRIGRVGFADICITDDLWHGIRYYREC